MLKFVAPGFNSNVIHVPGDFDINLASMTLNPMPHQNQPSTSSNNTGSSSHRKENNRYYNHVKL